MNAGKIGTAGALATLGGYLTGASYGLGTVGAGVVLLVFAASIVGWEEYRSRE